MRAIATFAVASVVGLSPTAMGQSAIDGPDLTIKTHRAFDRPNSTTSTEVLYLKGTRRRLERMAVFPGAASTTHIGTTLVQCDRSRRIELFPEHRTYVESPATTHISEPAGILRGEDPPGSSGPGRPVVTVTVETTDTGERRQIGRLAARHVITTKTTRPAPGASTPSRTDVSDGWYVDVSIRCHDDEPYGILVALGPTIPGRPWDEVNVVQHGPLERGYPIELTERSSEDGESITITTTTTLIELDEAPLAPALFELPIGYRPALPLPGGGFDPEQPDSFPNRARAYWGWFAEWAGQLVR